MYILLHFECLELKKLFELTETRSDRRRVRRTFHEHQIFISPKPADDILRPAYIGKKRRHFPNPVIPGIMSVDIIDRLKIINVHKHQCRYIILLHLCHIFPDFCCSRHFIPQTCHRIVLRLMSRTQQCHMRAIQSGWNINRIHNKHNLGGNHNGDILQWQPIRKNHNHGRNCRQHKIRKNGIKQNPV